MDSVVVTAPVMIPNTPDCTYDQGEPVLKPEQIREFHENYKKYKLIDMEHDFRDTYKTRGTVLKSWILEKPTSFLNFQGTQEIQYPKDTWMMTARVYDPTAVQLIQNGYLTGFSSSTINKSVADMRLKEAQKSKTLIKDIKDPVTYVVSLVHSPCLTQSKFCKCNISADKSAINEKEEDEEEHKTMSDTETQNETDEKKKEEEETSSSPSEDENETTSNNQTNSTNEPREEEENQNEEDEEEDEEDTDEEEEDEEKNTTKKQPNKEEANKNKGADKMDENSFFQKIKNLFEDTLNEREASKSTQATQDPTKVSSKTEKKDKAEEPKQPTEPTTQSESSTKQLQTLVDNLQTELTALKTQLGNMETKLDGFIKEGKSNKKDENETPKTQPSNNNNTNTTATTETDEKKKEEANKSKQVSSINDGFPNNNNIQLNETQFIYQQMGRNTRGSKIREN